MKFTISAALVALAVSSCARAQGFISNCTWQTAMLVDSYLGAYCNNNNWQIYSYDWTWFDISNCLMNSGGKLAAHESGNYWRSCKGCTIHPSPVDFILKCTCLSSPPAITTAIFDLNTIIWNHDGFLGCFERFGTRTERAPF
ncbi:hypothetical protein GGS20DRAFT_401209 [Poronia punctata]|nr:hypothetical protein GGS20DRAFT_401209 [Poronia punctata]